MLRLAASLSDGIPADLRDAFTGMDTANVDTAVRAMLHASGRRGSQKLLPYAGQSVAEPDPPARSASQATCQADRRLRATGGWYIRAAR